MTQAPDDDEQEALSLSRVQDRWAGSRPALGLTWGMDLAGDNFVSKAASYGVFGPDRAVLEIGAGYGRLFDATLRQQRPFKRYVAVDISEKNVRHLEERFAADSLQVVHAAIETVSLDERFDSVVSSLTIKHLYPTFVPALQNVERHLAPGAIVVFDLIEQRVEGELQYVHSGTYVRRYTRSQVAELIPQASLELVTLDHVVHEPGPKRLLVVARKPE
ncbi:MAG: class I SAM-dependent methyltransferase [Solirubrobacterales bacterium]